MAVAEIERALHAAADRIWFERGTSEMDGLAEAIGRFIAESDVLTDHGERLILDPASFGYGVMIGYLAGRGTE